MILPGKISPELGKLKEYIKKAGWIYWAAMIIMGVFLVSVAFPSDSGRTNINQEEELSYRADDSNKIYLEIRLENILESIEGVGKVNVMIMDDALESDMFSQNKSSKVGGILITAEGAGNYVVQKKIQDAVMALFQLEAHKIKVMKMK